MRVFARVVDAGSLAGAARALNLSAAAVTRLVTDLEDHLGARLINRSTRRLALTETGELYLARVQCILGDIDEAEALAGAATSQARGHLRVLAPPAFAVHQLAPQLPRFRDCYPQVTLELAVSGPVETVDENFDISIIVVARPLPGADFVARRLARSEIVACASPQYLDRHGRPQHPRDLLAHEAMVPSFVRELTFHRPGGAGLSGDEVVALTPPVPVLSTAHIDMMYASARAGLGIAGLPTFVAAQALHEGALERVLPDWHLVDAHIHAAMPTRKHVPARTRAFLEFLVQAFGGEDRDPWLPPGACDASRNARAG